MGQLFSCPLGDFEDLDFDAVLVRSISFQDGEMRNPLRSVSFNGRDSEPTILKSFGSHRIRLERPITTRTRELETVNSFKTPCAEMENSEFGISVGSKNCDQCRHEHFSSPHKYSTPRYSEPRHQHYSAALRLQKVYKSFRTRRQLADCAVLVEQRWFVSKFVCTLFKILNMFMSIYPFKSRSGKDLEFSFPKSSLNRWKLLDFAELKRSSISFFDIEKPETAISRWSRARTRAAKKSPYEEEERLSKDKFTSLQEDSEDHIGEIDTIDTIDENNPSSLLSSHAETPNQRISRLSRGLRSKITNLQIPERSNVFDIFKKETLPASCRVLIPDSPSDDGYETAEELFLSEEEFMVPKSNLVLVA